MGTHFLTLTVVQCQCHKQSHELIVVELVDFAKTSNSLSLSQFGSEPDNVTSRRANEETVAGTVGNRSG